MNGNRCWYTLLYLQGCQLKRRGSARLEVGNIVSVQTCPLKGVLFGGVSQWDCIYLWWLGKNYTCIALSRGKMKEIAFISGRTISFRCPLVAVSFLHQTAFDYKLSQTTIGFYLPASFWHRFLKYLLNPSATVVFVLIFVKNNENGLCSKTVQFIKYLV